MTESSIDFPKNGLCLDVWEKVLDANAVNEIWRLKKEVKFEIQSVYESVCNSLNIKFDDVHIIGSITSNQYTDKSDIDLHLLFSSKVVSDKETEDLNQKLQKTYVEKKFIKQHPIEVYFQNNKFQDMMSIGCYDFLKEEWIVGPEFVDKSFDPYSEYWKEIQNYSEKIAKQIRNMIFSIYEIAAILKKEKQGNDNEFRKNMIEVLKSRLSNTYDLFSKMREMRKVYSTPTSKEQALSYRKSRKWKIADASFKLFDKYGYIAILKNFIEDYELIENSDEVVDDVVNDILETVKNYINNADKLSEKEIYEDVECNEALAGKMIAYHVSNVPPEKIKREGFKAGQGNGATGTNLFDDLYEVDYPKNYLFVSKEPWDVDHPDKYRYCYKIDITDMDFYPDFGMLNYFGAYHEEGDDEEGQVFWWEDKDLKFMKNQKLKVLVMKQGGQLTTNEMMGGETVDGEYFPDALYDALGSAVIDGDVVNRENRILDVKDRMAHEAEEQVDEGPIQNMMLAALLAVPGLLPADQVQNVINKDGRYEVVTQELNKKTRMVGDYTAYQVANIIARTLYAEARSDGKEKGFIPVASVIYNRANGNKEDFAKVCLKKWQFSCWNGLSDDEKAAKNFKIKIPKNVNGNKVNQKLWQQAMEVASDMLTNGFTPVTTANSYYANSMKKAPKWANELTKAEDIGSHKFGYLKNHVKFT